MKQEHKRSFCLTDGHLSSEECRFGDKAPKIYKGRVVLRGDIGKDNSGSHAVFTERGSSASQMTAAKVIDIILSGCSGQAADKLYKVSAPCVDDHHFKEEELKSVGELLKVCSQIVLKCLYVSPIGRPDVLWSVNKLERSITKWAKACDKRLSRLIFYIHHTCGYKQHCHVGNTAKQCRLGLFQDSYFA